MRPVMLLLALLGAALMLAAGVGTAFAGRLSSSSQTFRATWARMRFSDNLGSEPVTCPVTLEGSYHTRSVQKVRSSLIGYITRAAIAEGACTGGPNGGHAEVATETLPWHVTYESFTGTLPNLTSISTNVLGAEIWMQMSTPFGPIWHHIRTDATQPMRLTLAREAGAGVTSVRVDETRTISSREGTAGTVSLEGTGGLSVLNSTTRISVTLI